MTRPRLLDLFCGAGGAAMGYHRAGFEVVGVDLHPQPRYPFVFHQADALTFPTEGFDAIHASPPCQRYSNATKRNGRQGRHPDHVGPTRIRLAESGRPYVIENVVGAPLLSPAMLCGSMLGLRVRKHRLFETSVPLLTPRCQHEWQDRDPIFDIYQHGRWIRSGVVYVFGSSGSKAGAHWNEAMGIDWMNKRELAQAIPPAYTEYIGGFLLRAVLTNSEAA